MFEQNIRVQWWRPLWEFLIHVLVGTAIFLVVALAAVALSLFVNWLEALKIDTFVVRVVRRAPVRNLHCVGICPDD